MHPLLQTLLALLLLVAPLRTAWADDDCNTSESAESTVADLQQAAATEAGAQEAWKLPSGALSAEDLEKAFEQITQNGQGIMGLFGLLADGQSRSIDGDVVRAMFQQYGVVLEFLPVESLTSISAENGKVTITFDFGSAGQKEIKLPDSEQKVLNSRHRTDPTLVDRKNRVRTEKLDGKTLKLKSELQFGVGENGLTGLRTGDIQVHHWLLGWVDIDLASERHEGKVAMGDKNRPVLQTDANGNPIVRDGHYQPQTYDDWVVITAKGRRNEVGIPPLQAQ